VPTPEAARKEEAEHPKPPKPTIEIFEEDIFF
jgi:hypothetical protein